MKVTGSKLYVRTREFDSSAGTGLAAILKTMKIPLYGKSCRFDGKVKKCAMITKEDMTQSEWEKLLGKCACTLFQTANRITVI